MALLTVSLFIKYYSSRIIKRNTESFKKAYIDSKKEEVKNDVIKTIESIEDYKKEEEIKITKNLRLTVEKIYTVYLALLRYSDMKNRGNIETFLGYTFSLNKNYYVAFFKDYNKLYSLLEKVGYKTRYIDNKYKNLYTATPIEIDGKLKHWGEIKGFFLCSNVIDRCIFVFEPKDKIEKEIKKKILPHIIHFNMVSNKNKYIFINKTNGEALILNNRIIDNGTKLWQINKNTSKEAKKVFEKELTACKKGGRFITYTWFKPKTGKISRKTSYIGCYKPWKWIIGEGFYYDNIDTIINKINNKIIHSIEIIIKILYILIAIVFAAIIAIFLIFVKILGHKRKKVIEQMRKSLDKGNKIDISRYKLKEIREFAENINKAIDIFRQYEDEFIKSLVNAIEMRDPYTQGHSQRVAYYSKVIAKTLGFDDTKQEELYRAGLLHDIGKIGIPDIILLKPDKLTPYEYEVVKYHAVFSFGIISNISRFRKIAKYIRHHHERCDGSGYPDRLKCDEIEIEARILAIADVFDALTSKRVYRKQINPEEALKIMEKDKLDQNILKKVKTELINAFLLEKNNEENPHISKVDKIRKELFDIDFKTGLKRRRIIINKANELLANKKPFIIALLKIENLNTLCKISFKKDLIVSNLSIFIKDFLSKEKIQTEFISYAFDDAFLILIEIKNLKNLDKIRNALNRLPKELLKRSKEKIDLHIIYKTFSEDFDSDFDDIIAKLRKNKPGRGV